MIDIQTLEESLGLVLPESYKTVLKNYPFNGSDYINCQLEINLDEVKQINLMFRQGEFGEKEWPDFHFTFGHDGAGNYFFLDLERNDEVIYCADHETHEITVEAENIKVWIDDWNRSLSKPEKKWWQFWKFIGQSTN